MWILTGGGAIFAAFPHWYATLFSGFYLALLLLLLALIVRAVAFEFRSKDKHPTWRATWDWMIFVGSAVPALLWGVALANLLKGTPIDDDEDLHRGLLRPPEPLHPDRGAGQPDAVHDPRRDLPEPQEHRSHPGPRAGGHPKKVGPAATVLLLLFAVGTYVWTDAFTRGGLNPGLVPLLALGSLLAAGALIHRARMGWGFVMTTLTILFTTATLFVSLYPRVMVSSLNPDWSLTVYNASSTPYTLTIMSIVAGIFVPIVLAYQAWTYWVFRHRVTAESRAGVLIP